jgi:hypothetical protein
MATPQPMRRSRSQDEQLRLMIKVARLYHERNVLQPEIARRLHISQARVSRLLKQAQAEGIVRTTVVVPDGVRTGMEETLEEAYGLREAVVVECFDDTEAGLTHDLGVATASYWRRRSPAATWSGSRLGARRCWRRSTRCGACPAWRPTVSSSSSAASATRWRRLTPPVSPSGSPSSPAPRPPSSWHRVSPPRCRCARR